MFVLLYSIVLSLIRCISSSTGKRRLRRVYTSEYSLVLKLNIIQAASKLLQEAKVSTNVLTLPTVLMISLQKARPAWPAPVHHICMSNSCRWAFCMFSYLYAALYSILLFWNTMGVVPRISSLIQYYYSLRLFCLANNGKTNAIHRGPMKSNEIQWNPMKSSHIQFHSFSAH